MSRFARIYPVYLLALLIALPFVFNEINFGEAARVLSMTQSWTLPASLTGYAWITQAWTLSVELVFYLMFPSFLTVVNKLTTKGQLLALIAVSVLIVAGGTSSIAPGFNEIDYSGFLGMIPLPLLRVPEFVLGMLLCGLFLRNRTRMTSWNPMLLNASFVIAVVLLLLLLAGVKGDRQLLGLTTLLFGQLIFMLAATESALTRMLSSMPLQALGGASYALYLLQNPVREWVKWLVPHQSVGQALFPVIILLVALAVFFMFESPLRRKLLTLDSFLLARP